MMAIYFKTTGVVDFSKIDNVQAAILTTSILLSGVFMRIWVYKNQDQFKKKFGIKD